MKELLCNGKFFSVVPINACCIAFHAYCLYVVVLSIVQLFSVKRYNLEAA